jgi:hypothetical protein
LLVSFLLSVSFLLLVSFALSAVMAGEFGDEPGVVAVVLRWGGVAPAAGGGPGDGAVRACGVAPVGLVFEPVMVPTQADQVRSAGSSPWM